MRSSAPFIPLLLAASVGACRPCERLQSKICEDLGSEDCAVWKGPEVDQAGIGSATMTSESCANAQSGPTYDRLLAAARTAVEHQKALERAREEGDAP